MKIFNKIIFLATLFYSLPSLAETYNLEVKKQNVFITGKAVESITINDQIPGPTLRFKEDENVVINVKIP